MKKNYVLTFCFTITLFLFFHQNLFSKSSFNNIQKIDVRDGISSDEIYTVIKDKYNFIWIGTNNGLNRFDGINVRQYHNNKFDKITIDHSIVEELIRANVITESEAKTHPRRNHITRAMGTDEMVIVDIFKSSLDSDDVVLLSTDGLTGFVEDLQIESVVSQNKNMDEISEELINMANDISGKDNVSVVLIKA